MTNKNNICDHICKYMNAQTNNYECGKLAAISEIAFAISPGWAQGLSLDLNSKCAAIF